MAIDRDKPMRVLDEVIRWPGRLRHLGGESRINLRFLEYQDTQGHIIFATQTAYHFKYGGYISICRKETFGERCLFCEVNQTNRRALFAKLIYRYATNAVVVDLLPSKVYSLIMPASVFLQLCNYVRCKKWADVMEPIDGRIFTVTCEGRGIKKRYYVKLTTRRYSVCEEVLSQVQDPKLAIEDPGYEGQREILREIKEW